MRTNIIAILLFAAWAATAQAQPVVKATPASGHPTATVTISGSGFDASEAVDVYLDSTDTVLLVSSSTGTVATSLTIPATAAPGVHAITAVGRRSGIAAQDSLNVSTPWLLQGFGLGHLGWNPYENVLAISNAGGLGTLWTQHLSTTGSTPVVAGGIVYVGTSTGVSAVYAATGAAKWTKTTGTVFDASGALSGTVLYIGDLSGNFYALNTLTGATIWSVRFGLGTYGSAVVSNGVVYVGSVDGVFHALNTNTGATIWTYTTGSNIDDSPALGTGNVYFGTYDGAVHALNATTGASVWSYVTGARIDSSPAVANGLLYIGSDDHKVYAIGTAAADAGQLVWSYTTNGIVYASPAVANGMVYIGSGDQYLYAFPARTGLQPTMYTAKNNVRSAVVANGVVYFTSDDNTFWVLNTTSLNYPQVLASAPIGSAHFGSPAVSDGRVFVATSSGDLVAFSLNGGTEVVRRAPRPGALRPDMGLRVTR